MMNLLELTINLKELFKLQKDDFLLSIEYLIHSFIFAHLLFYKQ